MKVNAFAWGAVQVGVFVLLLDRGWWPLVMIAGLGIVAQAASLGLEMYAALRTLRDP